LRHYAVRTKSAAVRGYAIEGLEIEYNASGKVRQLTVRRALGRTGAVR
jgi:hypothetical protein